MNAGFAPIPRAQLNSRDHGISFGTFYPLGVVDEAWAVWRSSSKRNRIDQRYSVYYHVWILSLVLTARLCAFSGHHEDLSISDQPFGGESVLLARPSKAATPHHNYKR